MRLVPGLGTDMALLNGMQRTPRGVRLMYEASLPLFQERLPLDECEDLLSAVDTLSRDLMGGTPLSDLGLGELLALHEALGADLSSRLALLLSESQETPEASLVVLSRWIWMSHYDVYAEEFYRLEVVDGLLGVSFLECRVNDLCDLTSSGEVTSALIKVREARDVFQPGIADRVRSDLIGAIALNALRRANATQRTSPSDSLALHWDERATNPWKGGTGIWNARRQISNPCGEIPTGIASWTVPAEPVVWYNRRFFEAEPMPSREPNPNPNPEPESVQTVTKLRTFTGADSLSWWLTEVYMQQFEEIQEGPITSQALQLVEHYVDYLSNGGSSEMCLERREEVKGQLAALLAIYRTNHLKSAVRMFLIGSVVQATLWTVGLLVYYLI